MDPNRIARLTDQQRICLRLVYSHMTSKEIAPRLGIEPNSVDQHIKAAMRVLGVGDRRTAARMLAEHEGAWAARSLVYQSLDVATAPDPLTFPLPTESDWQQRGTRAAGTMREEQAAFEAAPLHRPPIFPPPLPFWGGRPGDLSALQRLGWIFAIMLAIALTFGMFMAGVEALSRLGRALA